MASLGSGRPFWVGIFLCWLFGFAAADELQKAREALDRGRPDLALSRVRSDSLPSRITRLEALCELGEYTQARALLRGLEEEQHRNFPSPYDYRFYLFRGVVEAAAGNYELADKNYREAERRASCLEERVRVWIHQTQRWLDTEELDRAEEIFEQTRTVGWDALPAASVAALLELSARLQYERGERAGAVASSLGAREIYRSLSQRSRAARALHHGQVYREKTGDQRDLLAGTETALAEFLEAGNYAAALRLLESFRYLFFNLAGSQEGRRITPLFRTTIERFPAGREREQALLAWGRFQLDTAQHTEATAKLFTDLTQSSDRETCCLAYQGLASYHGDKGEREQALSYYEKAMEFASPQMRADPQWRVSSGAILLRMSYQEKARRNYAQAIRLAHRGIQLQPGADWAYWRVESRYDTLMAAMESFELEAAQRELAAALEEIDRLPKISQRVGTLTTILSSLLLNQSVEADVMDPAVLLLSDYPETTRKLLRETFEQAGGTDRYLVLFEQWNQQLGRQEEGSLQAYPLIYKGLFLEALGRYREANSALQSALEIAERREMKQAQMLSRVLLARVLFAQGEDGSAVDQLTRAARVSQLLNPLAARFYTLVAGSAQRENGRLEEALDSFDRAIELLPEKAWPGLYGKALTLERMGRYQEALQNSQLALTQISGSERIHSIAELRALEARLLARLGRTEEALPLYAQAHRRLLYSTSLASVTVEYGRLLVVAERPADALQIYTETLDSMSEMGLKLSAEQQTLFESTVSLALQLGQHDTALKYLQLSHSIELLDSLDLSKMQAEDEETRTLLREVANLKLKMQNLRLESGQAGDSETHESVGQQLAATRGEFLAKINQLKTREPDFEALVQVSASELAALQKLVPPDTALLEYFPAESTLYVFLVTSDSFSLHQVSLSRRELSTMTERLVELCANPQSSQKEIERLSRSLYDALVGVVGAELKGRDSLRVIPSGPIWEVPFAALRSPDFQTLSTEYELSYLGSSELLKMLSRRQVAETTPALLVQGAEELKGAGREIEELAKLLGEARLLRGDQLDQAAFGEAVKGCRLVHLASHSVVSRQAEESYVQMGSDRLTTDEIYGLELEPSCLVVLSSCRSAVGVAAPGKEVTSLATAFSVAGASTVVASRWPVDDRATALFFDYFYRELLSGKSRGQALRAAQTRMAKDMPHPYYWAAFNLLGDPG